MKETILRLYKEHHPGKENAISRAKFRDEYGWLLPGTSEWGLPDPSDRKFRDIYSKLPICTCNKGGFYPIRPAEIKEFRSYLRKKAIPHFVRFNMVRDAHPELSKDINQLELFWDDK